jgi:hypothetical protein
LPDKKDNPFKCNEIFKWMSEKVYQNLFEHPTNQGSRPAVYRHFVLALMDRHGETRPYEYNASLGLPRLSGADRAELHSALLGRQVTIDELKHRESDTEKFMLTKFTGPAFGLTDFDSGTLLSLSCLMAAGRERDAESKHCLAANIRSCSQTALALACLLEAVNSSVTENPKIDELARSANGNLQRLKSGGGNRFCKGFAAHNTRISKFLD